MAALRLALWGACCALPLCAAAGGDAPALQTAAEGNRSQVRPHPKLRRPVSSLDTRLLSPLAPLPRAAPEGRILLFTAVGSKPAAMQVSRNNIDQLRKALGSRMDVYLVHYDSKQAEWLKEDAAWYQQNVQFSAQQPGFKFQLAQRLLPDFLSTRSYEWIWLIDEDLDFTGIDAQRALDIASASGSLIVQPAVRLAGDTHLEAHPRAATRAYQHEPGSKGAALAQFATQTVGRLEARRHGLGRAERSAAWRCQPGDAMCDHAKPHQCLYRHVNFVEVMMPLIRQAALVRILTGCDHCIHEKSTWGLDMVWCFWTARQFNMDPKRGCAILDQVSVQHLNLKTLDKWDAKGNRRYKAIKEFYWSARNDVESRYQGDFQSTPRTLSCAAE